MAKKSKQSKAPSGPATIQNRKARFDFHIEETHEAGIVLVGPEVKSIYLGNAQLTDGYVKVENGELWLIGVYVAPYEQAYNYNVETRRSRKLLMHKAEIRRIAAKAQEKGLTLIPLKLYFNHGKAKLEIALARGRREYDKREAIQEKDERRERQRGPE
jgi:SsrA-binding protein